MGPREHTEIWKKIKKIGDAVGFMPPRDGMLMCATNKPVIDLIAFDKKLADRDSEYDPENCTYKGKPDYSMSKYIEEKFGKETVDLVAAII